MNHIGRDIRKDEPREKKPRSINRWVMEDGIRWWRVRTSDDGDRWKGEQKDGNSGWTGGNGKRTREVGYLNLESSMFITIDCGLSEQKIRFCFF